MGNLEINEKVKATEIILKNNILRNIKSKYILHKIFNYLEAKRKLNLIRHNKNIKEKLNININNYKKCSEIYSSIEIEIKLANNKYGKFININNENEKYFHIYFNDNKEELKRNYLRSDDKVSKIKIIIDYQIKSFELLFYECKCIESINFKKFYRNNITNMGGMFGGCSSLKELNLSNFNTNNVTDMGNMFSECSYELKEKIKKHNKNIKF